MGKIAKWKQIEIEEFKKIVKESFSIIEILYKTGYSSTGGTHKEITNFLKINKISTLHFKKKLPTPTYKYKDSEKFCINSVVSRSALKKHIINKSIIPYHCAECLLSKEWRGKPIVLILDHINGMNRDNRIENLRFLCPNCNAQTPTFSGKNKTKSNQDMNEIQSKRKIKHEEAFRLSFLRSENKKLMRINKKAQYEKENKNYFRDTPVLLEKGQIENSLLKNRSMFKAAKELGCSDHTLKKHCKKLNIDYKKIFQLYPLASKIISEYKKSNSKDLSVIALKFKTSPKIIKLHLRDVFDLKPLIKVSEEKKKKIKIFRKDGLTIKEIAIRLGISTTSVKLYK